MGVKPVPQQMAEIAHDEGILHRPRQGARASTWASPQTPIPTASRLWVKPRWPNSRESGPGSGQLPPEQGSRG